MKKLLILSLAASAFILPKAVHAVTCNFGSEVGTTGMCRGFITATADTTWSVPSDWNNASNTIEVIGGGGGTSQDFTGRGGGGGAYAKVSNQTLSGSVGINVADGGAGDNDGENTWFCNSTSNCTNIEGSAVIVGAQGGKKSGNGGAGGSTASSVGTVKYAGGNGGAAYGHASGEGGSGGGGAAGPQGAGAVGGSNSDAGTRTLHGAGGGGNGGGSVGHSLEVEGNHNGGNNFAGSGGGSGGSIGGSAGNGSTGGGGGGGGFAGNGGGTGGSGQDWDATHGSGGGGGGGSENDSGGPGDGGLYGAGAGGIGPEGSQGTGSGAQGIIVISYNPSAVAASASLSRYRWRADDGTETSASYLASQNSAISSNIIPGDRIRLRMGISQTGTASHNFRLEYASSSCSSWTAVPSYGGLNGEHWAMDYTQHYANGIASTDQSGLTNPNGVEFVSGYLMSSSNQTNTVSLSDPDYTELEFSIKSSIYSVANVQYCFRVTNAGSTTGFEYTVQPQITLSAAAQRTSNGGIITENIGSGPMRGGGAIITQRGNAGGEPTGNGNIIGGGNSGGGGGGIE